MAKSVKKLLYGKKYSNVLDELMKTSNEKDYKTLSNILDNLSSDSKSRYYRLIEYKYRKKTAEINEKNLRLIDEDVNKELENLKKETPQNIVKVCNKLIEKKATRGLKKKEIAEINTEYQKKKTFNISYGDMKATPIAKDMGIANIHPTKGMLRDYCERHMEMFFYYYIREHNQESNNMADFLVAKRKEAGLSRKKFAEKSNGMINYYYMPQIEGKIRSITFGVFSCYAEILEIPVKDLFNEFLEYSRQSKSANNALKNARKQAGLTKKELSEKMNISLSKLEKLESGQTYIGSYRKTCQYAEALGISGNDLIEMFLKDEKNREEYMTSLGKLQSYSLKSVNIQMLHFRYIKTNSGKRYSTYLLAQLIEDLCYENKFTDKTLEIYDILKDKKTDIYKDMKISFHDYITDCFTSDSLKVIDKRMNYQNNRIIVYISQNKRLLDRPLFNVMDEYRKEEVFDFDRTKAQILCRQRYINYCQETESSEDMMEDELYNIVDRHFYIYRENYYIREYKIKQVLKLILSDLDNKKEIEELISSENWIQK